MDQMTPVAGGFFVSSGLKVLCDPACPASAAPSSPSFSIIIIIIIPVQSWLVKREVYRKYHDLSRNPLVSDRFYWVYRSASGRTKCLALLAMDSVVHPSLSAASHREALVTLLLWISWSMLRSDFDSGAATTE
ncbi:uncharacterized protein BO97DRAFT_479928 [Aspergillus homomorphus CBS 101889]|uniref:Uncharacterized protein n=1 Tax=Aspergillus homomorphus (strain CBS 101889) TaxID=1450537 RepID=A0A395HNT1_ASPHC|nr:hypothetical protein BO97DRAFT_479928 [Aspergillus homomorphus CBS 101889]RAL09477.1 hypothetical protein BO97DRAFT_479928 [Aspergillus homomorphus CBS 101889]